MKRVQTIFLLLVSAVAGWLILAGCGSRPDGSDVRAVLDSLPSAPNGYGHCDSIEPPADSLIIYIDASTSMRGFLPRSAADSVRIEFRRFLSQVNVWATGVCPRERTSFKAFDSAIYDMTTLSQARARSFYKVPATALLEVLGRIASAEPAPKATLVITDAIPILPGGHAHEWDVMVEHIQNWVRRGYYFQIVQLKGHFHDNVWSVMRQDVIAVSGPRPYYCFVFSTDGTHGLSLHNRLRSAERSADMPPGPDDTCRLLDVTGRIVRDCSVVVEAPDEVVVEGVSRGNPLQYEDLDGGVYLLHWRRPHPKQALVGRADLKLEVELTHEHYGLEIDGSCLDARISGVTIYDNSPLEWEPASGAGLAFSSADLAADSANPTHFRCGLEFTRGDGQYWDAYRVAIVRTKLVPPAWVEEISTERDDRPQDWCKTMNLSSFVESILNREQKLADLYLAVGR
ncbi:hypothetical protein JXD38_05105 [candidate division WOR-3 bacterium]|nr:hypothetical protein [candidate division WOR-3 bacterium]